jgi:beta-galactosidase
MKKCFAIVAAICLMAGAAGAQQVTELHDGWKFALGNAADPALDFGCGTEYFNYITKAAGIHNTGPYSPGFDDSAWQDISVPHDWVTTLPYAPEASHSHGYKMIGYKYPETSVGWYRKSIVIPSQKIEKSSEFDDPDADLAEPVAKHYELRFDGIFRNATVWFNGVYMGTEPSGYAVQVYDITPYINYDGENIICVRADASLEEGWFYEGAGIYRNAYLIEKSIVHATEGGIYTVWADDTLTVYTELESSAHNNAKCEIIYRLLDADGREIAAERANGNLKPGETATFSANLKVPFPHLWDVDDPYLYTLETSIWAEMPTGKTAPPSIISVPYGSSRPEIPIIEVCTDVHHTKVGLRSAEFNAEEGFVLNGRKVILKGVNLHQDHAGTGSAMPDGLIEWRVKQLQKLGVNAIRCSHNPATPALLDICDRLGVMVIDENRLMGINAEHKRLLENMVRFGRNHPCVILWSMGNEEWGLENNPAGVAIVQQMQDYVHLLDPSRQTTAANAGGSTLIEGLQVHGYNYIVQNDVEGRHERHPEWIIFGSEETTGCGTRGVYFPEEGRMPSINRTGSPENVIERGWQFYRDHPWAGGVFFWTGIDYKGEPNPLAYPAVLSEFGILDYCGFPKDEARYLKAAWTDETILHVFPHWNLQGHEGEAIDLWVYSNCDKVQLKVNGKNLGTKAVPKDGHLKFTATYKPGKVVAVGYKGNKKVITRTIETTGPAKSIMVNYERIGKTVIAVATINDSKGRIVPDACNEIHFSFEGVGKIIGGGNGDPAWHGIEHCFDGKEFTVPAFNGRALVVIETDPEQWEDDLETPPFRLNAELL